jgi:SSS family solute:Na+ symporter/sodium/pantothenate symporter
MTLAWSLFLLYLVGTAYLAWLGYKRTKDFDSFAIGTGDMSPIVVGITLAASVASAATFIINPGFIYVHGLSAFMHFVVAVGLGFCLMLVMLSFRFRRLGEANKALTMPHWIGERFKSKGIAIYFAAVNLFALAFVVLIVGGLSIVMQQLLGISNIVSLIIILGFVTSYIFIGGTYAHAFTNTLQGSLMLVVS